MNENNVAHAGINNFLPNEQMETIEITVSDFQNILKDTLSIYNQLAEMLKDSGVLRDRELAKMTAKAQDGLKAAGSPAEKILLANAYIKQLLALVREALKSRQKTQGGIRQAITKIQLRAEALIGHIREIAEGKERISLASPRAREYLAGMEGKPVSRRDCIRAIHRAEKICPALVAGHVGGRATMRLTAKVSDIVACGNGPGWMA